MIAEILCWIAVLGILYLWFKYLINIKYDE